MARESLHAMQEALLAADSSAGHPVPHLAPFIAKLYEIITLSIGESAPIAWGPTGTTFVISDQKRFAEEILPRYFKHKNMRSFSRQLNMYGFQRCRNSEGRPGSILAERGEIEFKHTHFLQGRPDLIFHITRVDTIPSISIAGKRPHPGTFEPPNAAFGAPHSVAAPHPQQLAWGVPGCA